MIQIHLHGSLEKYGGPYTWDVGSPKQAARALCQLDGFEQELRAGSFHVICGNRETGFAIGEDEVGLRIDGFEEIHFIPALEGAKGRGSSIGKVVLGIALVAVAFYAAPPLMGQAAAAGVAPTAGGLTNAAVGVNLGAPLFTLGGMSVTYGNVALFGISMALQGVAGMLAPSPQVEGVSSREPADQRPSFLFSGPVNVAEQGHVIPLAYGEVMAGSVVVSSGIQVEEAPLDG